MTLVVRTAAEPLALDKAVQLAVWSINKDLPISALETMDEVIAGSVWQQRFNLLLVGLFATAALTLAAVGIYGVMSYSVTQRTHEIGIRMALGAGQRDVERMVVREAMTLAAIGGAVGLGGGVALTRVLGGVVFQGEATHPGLFPSGPVILSFVAFP